MKCLVLSRSSRASLSFACLPAPHQKVPASPCANELAQPSTSPSIHQSSIQYPISSTFAKLAKDTLPAIDAAKIEEIKNALKEYQQVQTDQTSGQSETTTDRAKLEAAVKDIAARRREIQFAADDQWPHTNKENAGIRAKFKLPVDRALQ